MKPTILLACLATLAAPAAASAQDAPPATAPQAQNPLDMRAKQLFGLIQGAVSYDSYFAPEFQKAVSREQFDQLTGQITDSYGPPLSILSIEPASQWAATVTIRFASTDMVTQISVAPEAPHKVTGLRITGFSAIESTPDDVLSALEGLHGRTGYMFARLTDDGPEVIRALEPDAPFAVGSAFKLVILAEIVRRTNAGTLDWEDMVTLDGSELPGGAYSQSPAGTQVSVRELAGKMISISDNSATDILLRYLGREQVEAMLTTVGIRHAALNRPLLATLELFKLKGVGEGALGDRWIAGDEGARRELLAGDVAAAPIATIDPELFADGMPVRIDSIEYFFSPADLVRTLDWLRRNSTDNSAVRQILSENPGIAPTAAEKWAYVGYKGGSEPGVINMTLLLQAENGDWYAFTASWNDTGAAVDIGRFAGLMSRFAELVAAAPDTAGEALE